MLKFKDNPPITLPSLPSVLDAPGDWAAVYCKPRQEKALAWDLCRLEVPYFLPMLERVTHSGGRRRRNMYAMFKSYLFFAGEEEQRLAVLQANRHVRFVPIDPAAQPSFRRELGSLEIALCSATEKIELYPQLVVGRRVLVISGPMKGAEGTILDAADVTKLWVGVTMMGTGVSVEIHADMVEPLSSETEGASHSNRNSENNREAAGRIELPVGAGKHVVAKPSATSVSERLGPRY